MILYISNQDPKRHVPNPNPQIEVQRRPIEGKTTTVA